ncbi:alpha/beta fold hydrolase [Streptomyces sp. T12]|uniref:alpha/beta fold hydrolase n=1 Tax=Streptomyces sp. T12 TaxID=477697 RepID=UPI0035A33EBB
MSSGPTCTAPPWAAGSLGVPTLGEDRRPPSGPRAATRPGLPSPGGPHAVERDRSVRRALAQPDPEAARLALTDLTYSPGLAPLITAPTLIPHGDQDRLTPLDNLPLLATRIPDARTHLFPGARHACFEECRAEAGPLVETFLNERS